MKKEGNILMGYARKIIDKDKIGKLSQIVSNEEYVSSLQIAITTALRKRFRQMEAEILIQEQKGKNMFFAKTKALMMKGKIEHFSIEYDKKDLEYILNIMIDIKGEINGV